LSAVFLLQAGIFDLDLSLVAEILAFLIMLAILARWVYPRVIEAAEGRQRQITEQLEAAERARSEAEARLNEAEQRLREARGQAQEVIAAASKSAEQLRQELRARAEEDAKRLLERAREDIESERRRALESVRGAIADLVVAATEKVIRKGLDPARQRELIEEAIQEVGDGRSRS
jgi:F-type H+-transporting ATPase subunit b